MVAREDERFLGVRVAQHVQVLDEGVRRPPVPARAAVPEVRVQELDAAPLAVQVPRLADAHVFHERTRAVLRQQVDAEESRVDAVREGEVDDAVLPRDGDGRLGAVLGEHRQAAPLPAHEDEHIRPHADSVPCQEGGQGDRDRARPAGPV